MLKQFEARKAQGEALDKLEFSAVIPDDQGQQTFRYMKAIPTTALCLTCHGQTLPAEVDAKLKELYPNDQARQRRGFAWSLHYRQASAMSGLIWNAHLTVATVVERDGRFLLVEEYAGGTQLVFTTSRRVIWMPMRTLAAAAIRETLEETAWEVAVSAIIDIYYWNNPQGETFIAHLLCRSSSSPPPASSLG